MYLVLVLTTEILVLNNKNTADICFCAFYVMLLIQLITNIFIFQLQLYFFIRSVDISTTNLK